MKNIYTLTAAMLLSCAAFAQTDSLPHDTIWHTGGLIGVNFNQTSFTNWASGGDNVIAVNGLFHIHANYKQGRSAWDNSLDLGYGQVKTGDLEMRKSDDKIDLFSKYGYDINGRNKWFYSLLFNFKSQFAPGYEYPSDSTRTLISEFASPAYAILALGIDYKPTEYFSVFFSPLTVRATTVYNQDIADAGTFGNDPAEYNELGVKIKDGENVRMEYGALVNAKFQKDIATNVNLMTKIDLFSNYTENPQNVDVAWEVLLAMKVNKYLTASINTILVYDDDVSIQEYEVVNGYRIPKINPGNGSPVAGPRMQFKEVLAIGLAYKFGH